MNFWFTRNRFEQQMEAEFRFHLDTRVSELMRGGLTRCDAESRAKKEFGAVDLAKDECRDQLALEWLGDFWRDIRYAARSLRRNPVFALTAIVTLALGIGANTAVFSLVNATLLRALPYPYASRLVRVGEKGTLRDVSIPEYEFWKEHSREFSSVAGYQGREDQRVSWGSRTEWVPGMVVTTDFFRTLGVSMAEGREFISQEASYRGPRAAILSNRLWRSLGADPALAGRVITIGEASYSVVGILPEGFWFPQDADIFLPLRPSGSAGDEGSNTNMIGRLAQGVSLQQAEAGMAVISESFKRSNATNVLQQDRHELTLTTFQRWLVGDMRLKLLLLFGAVGLLLLIACLNVASLILARLAARQREIAVRRALGSSSRRLFRQFAVENLLLCMAGGVIGLACAYFLLQAVGNRIALQIPVTALGVDWTVMAFAFSIVFVTGLIFTAAPLFVTARNDIFETLRQAGQAVGSGQRMRSVLVVGQVALSVTLLVGAALLIQSLNRLNHEALGFMPEGVITFSTRPAAGQLQFESALLQKIASLPGVRAVAAANVLPLADKNNFPTERVGHPDQSIGGMEIRLISPEYFRALGIPVLRGRSFNNTDVNGGLPVILISESLARSWWAKGNPIGDQIKVGRYEGRDLSNDPVRQVVGVVGDTKTLYLNAPPRPTVYIPIAQGQWGEWGFSWVVRATQVKALEQQLKQAVADVDNREPVEHLRTMEEIVDSTNANSRFDAWLFGGFAGLALLLTAVGLYGLLSFSVARRTSEIGTRLALGAGRSKVIELILWQGMRLVTVGLFLGLAGAVLLTRSLSSLLFGVRVTDPASYCAVALIMLAVSCWRVTFRRGGRRSLIR